MTNRLKGMMLIAAAIIKSIKTATNLFCSMRAPLFANIRIVLADETAFCCIFIFCSYVVL